MAFPPLFILTNLLSGLHCSDYTLETNFEYFYPIFRLGTAYLFLQELFNQKATTVNWFLEKKNNQIYVSIWTSFWIKVLLFLSLIAFFLGFFEMIQ